VAGRLALALAQQSMDAYKIITNHELVIEAFGYWPSLHDAEVFWIKLERVNETYKGYFSPNIEFEIHGWEMTNEITEKGYYKLHKHHLIHFKFEDVFDVEFDGFNHQNAILGLGITEESQTEAGITPLKVTFDPAYGLGGEFKAYKGAVLRISPCDENGNISQQKRGADGV
jgi:hypothetical protein